MPRIFNEERVKLEQAWNQAAVHELEHGKERLVWLTSLSESFQQWVSSISLFEGVKTASPRYRCFHFTVIWKDLCIPFKITYCVESKKMVLHTQKPFTETEHTFLQHVVEQMKFNEKEWQICY